MIIINSGIIQKYVKPAKQKVKSLKKGLTLNKNVLLLTKSANTHNCKASISDATIKNRILWELN